MPCVHSPNKGVDCQAAAATLAAEFRQFSTVSAGLLIFDSKELNSSSPRDAYSIAWKEVVTQPSTQLLKTEREGGKTTPHAMPIACYIQSTAPHNSL